MNTLLCLALCVAAAVATPAGYGRVYGNAPGYLPGVAGYGPGFGFGYGFAAPYYYGAAKGHVVNYAYPYIGVYKSKLNNSDFVCDSTA